MLIEFTGEVFLVGIAVLLVVLLVLYRRKRSFSFLFCFAIFWLYLLGVLKMAIFPIHIPIPGQLNQEPFSPRMNLVPFYFRCWPLAMCLREILGNIFLTMPFGFIICFLLRLKARDFLWVAPAVGLTLEGTQLALSLLLRSAFRAVDINDVLLNALGVGLGYAFFRLFAWLYLRTIARFGTNPKGLLSYIQEMSEQKGLRGYR
jgi:glycopeptide antibiotics resistance protein